MKLFIYKNFLILVMILFSQTSFAKSDNSIIVGNKGSKLQRKNFGKFDEPWAMTFLSDNNLLVTQKRGALLLVKLDENKKVFVQGLPSVAYGGQGGLGDVILHPNYKNNSLIYISYAKRNRQGNKGAVVARAKLILNSNNPKLVNLQVIWKQQPKVSGSGHYSHRLAFGPNGYLFITSGERQKQTPAQDFNQALGKIIRLFDNGEVPPDNPFQNKGELAKTFWTLGHRNLLGIAFDKKGSLWTHEMGPRHGDEFNLIKKGGNYGWPIVSWGNQYSGIPIPDHDTRPEFNAPEIYWIPTIAPSGLIIYNADMFLKWQGNAFLGGLRSESLVRIQINGEKAKEVERFDMGKRIREIEQGPKGAIWALEDRRGAKLLRLTPIN